MEGLEHELKDEYPTMYYSRGDQCIIKVNDKFEHHFGSSGKVVGEKISEITQPILTDDFSVLPTEKYSREYAFLKVDETTPQLVELLFGAKPGEKDIGSVAVRSLFPPAKEKSLKSFLDHNDIILLADSQGGITRANEQAAQVLGYRQNAISQMEVSDITHDSIRSYLKSKWKKFIEYGEVRGEHLLENKSGDIIISECRGVANVRLGTHLLIFRQINKISQSQHLKLEVTPQKETFEEALTGIVFTDSNFNLRYVNNTCLNMLGYQKEEMVGKPVSNFCKSMPKLQAIENVLRAENEWQGYITALDANEEEIYLKVKITSLNINDNENVKWQGRFQDISKRVMAEKKITESKNRFESLMRAAPDGILIVDEDGLIENANDEIYEMLGYRPSELLGKPIELLVPEHNEKKHIAYREKFAKNPHKRSMGSGLDLFAQHKNGSKVPVDIKLGPCEKGNQRTIAIVRDISKYRNTQQKLEAEKEFTELLHRLTIIANENMPLKQKMKQSIQEICQFMSWPVGHVYLPANDGSNEFYPSDIWYVEDQEKFESFKKMTMCTRFKPGVGMIGEVMETGETQWYDNVHENPGFVRRMPEVDLKIRTCFGLPILVKDEVVGVLEFFSDRILSSDSILLKKMTTVGYQLGRAVEREESESLIKRNMKLFKKLFEHTPAGIVLLDDNEEVIDLNEAFTEIFGYSYEELEGNKLENFIVPEDLEAKALEFTQRTFRGEPINKETIRTHKDGSKIPVVIHTVPIKIENKIEVIFSIYVDLTKVRKTEKELRESLEEKKFLLEEIHHRVKNNLAIITSLLELQINQAEDSIVIQQLKDSQARIYSMAMVHEHLYQMESFSYLKLDVYIKKLVKKIRSTFADHEMDIKLNFNTESVKVTLDQAISCGQLINELVTNSFKHAFDYADKGSITISLVKKDEILELKITDSGPGIPEEVLDNEQSSLGLKLVNVLSKQLDGNLEIKQDDGSIFCITFPKKL